MYKRQSLGAKILHNRSVEMAKKYGVELVVLSSLTRAEGTVVKEETKVERMLVSGVAVDKNTARISVLGVKNEPGIAFRIFNMLAKNQINVDIIIQSVGREDKKDISFTVARTDPVSYTHLIHGAVTIATNMAGRGTDIKLDEESRAAGGLKIIGTERHESRRIDNQLRGRSGRQGDPGESRFYLSLEDDLMRLFGCLLYTSIQHITFGRDIPLIYENIFGKNIPFGQMDTLPVV